MRYLKILLVAFVMICSFSANAWTQYLADELIALGGAPGQIKGFGASFKNNDVLLRKTTYKTYINSNPVTLGNGHCVRASKDLNSGIITQICDVLIQPFDAREWCEMQGAALLTGNNKEFFNRIYVPALLKIDQGWGSYAALYRAAGVDGLLTKNRYQEYSPSYLSFPNYFNGVSATNNEYFYKQSGWNTWYVARYDSYYDAITVTCQWGAAAINNSGYAGFNGW